MGLIERAWSKVDRGELGAAFELLWEAETLAGSPTETALARAEFQAFCGNQDAALGLLAELNLGRVRGDIIRARVAALRGDWEEAQRCALRVVQAEGGPARAARARLLAARALLELGDACAAAELLDAMNTEDPGTELSVALLVAHGSTEDPAEALARLAEDAAQRGAARISADAWADASAIHAARGRHEQAHETAMRALELWDEMATSLPPPLRAGFWNDARRRAARALAKPSKEPRPSASGVALERLLLNLRQLASERDLSKLLALITDGAVALAGAERGFVLLVGEDGALEPATMRSAESELGMQSAAFSRSIAETVLIDAEPVVTVDAATDARVSDYLSVHQLMLKSVACLPIETRGRTWGVLYLEHRSASGRFAGTDLSLLRAYADQAAIAIETSQLFERVERQTRDLERANQALRDANRHLERRVHGQEEALEQTKREIARLQGGAQDGARWGLVGASEGMRRVYDVLERVCANDVPVIITGESGTGKELVARAVHRGSARAEGPWVSLSCASIPEGLLESELFGHVAGAFTGATRPHEGVFAQAHGGTLFLDEIADMPPRMQLDLLRVLQEGRVRPVGADEEIPVDVRLVSASNRDLQTLIEEGRLREDLYYRLAVVELRLPPLRERRADIPLLCDHFLRKIGEERGLAAKRMSRAAMQRLCSHGFPGNVRELEHILLSATVFEPGETIDADALSLESPAPISSSTGMGTYRDFKDAERDQIVAALNAHGWNRAQAARALGIPRRTFYRRLKEHGIELPSAKP